MTINFLKFFFDDGKYNDVSQIWKQGRKIKCRYDHGDPSRVHVFVEKFSVRQSVLLKISALANCFYFSLGSAVF